MSTLFNIGVNGLKAQQTALNVTGQNITNASTPGYSRQRADIISATGSLSNGVFSGSGAKVDRIQRIADDFASNQIRVDQSLSSELEAFSLNVGQLESALYNDGAGIDSAMSEFFDALQSASNNPLDAASRQFVIGKGVALAERFDGVAQRIERQGQDISSALQAGASRINELSGLVAETNRRISLLQDGRDSDGLNAMIDQRDNLLKDLASWVGINTSIQSDGQANVFIGKGQSLILGAQAAELDVSDSGDIFLRQAGTFASQKVTTRLSGGEMGGLLGYREQILDVAQNELGHLAASVSYAFNQQHQLGVDLDGEFGADFFRDINDPNLVGQRVGILPRENSSSSIGQVNVYIDDPLSNIAASYSMRVEADGSFSITRDTDDALVYQGANISTPSSVSFDGLTVEFANGAFNPGDALQIKPYASYATEMDVVLSDPTSLALGAPVGLEASASNSGSAQLSLGGITDPNHPIFSADQALVPPLLVRFISDSQYEILDNSDPANPVRLDPDLGVQNYLQGSQNHILPYTEGTSLVTSSGPQVSSFAGSPQWVSDLSAGDNGYPLGALTISQTNSDGTTQDSTLAVPAGSSAADIADMLSAQSGVRATARTVLNLENLVNYQSGAPVELAVNGELITNFNSLGELADAINANSVLQSQGIVARSDGQTLELVANNGDDLTLHFQGDPNESIEVVSAKGERQSLNGSVPGNYQRITVGGEISVMLTPDTRMQAQLDGVFAANPVHQRGDFGLDLLLTGNVAAGDEFAISFSGDAAGDNRNARALGMLNSAQIVGDPAETFASKFASLVLDVGAAAGQAEVNRSAAASLLEQSESYRESVSGVNLDEEAANLIRFEQAYNASAQIISVARDTFNVLLNAI